MSYKEPKAEVEALNALTYEVGRVVGRLEGIYRLLDEMAGVMNWYRTIGIPIVASEPVKVSIEDGGDFDLEAAVEKTRQRSEKKRRARSLAHR